MKLRTRSDLTSRHLALEHDQILPSRTENHPDLDVTVLKTYHYDVPRMNFEDAKTELYISPCAGANIYLIAILSETADYLRNS